MTDSECLTIEVVGPYLGYSTQKQLYERMRDRFGAWFPALGDRVALVRQSANLWPVKAWYRLNLWITKILAHTVCVFLNIRLNRDPLDFDGLVRF